MLKKWTLAALLALTALYVLPTHASKQSWTDLFKMKASICLYWDCPGLYMRATGLSAVVDSVGRRPTLQSVTLVRADAKFFAERVVFTDPGKEPTQLYDTVVVRIHPGDQVTVIEKANEVSMDMMNRHTLDLFDGQARTLKINGRPLISKDLATAHQAIQNLVFDGVIAPPGNEYRSATNARLLNKAFLEK